MIYELKLFHLRHQKANLFEQEGIQREQEDLEIDTATEFNYMFEFFLIKGQ